MYDLAEQNSSAFWHTTGVSIPSDPDILNYGLLGLVNLPQQHSPI